MCGPAGTQTGELSRPGEPDHAAADRRPPGVRAAADDRPGRGVRAVAAPPERARRRQVPDDLVGVGAPLGARRRAGAGAAVPAASRGRAPAPAARARGRHAAGARAGPATTSAPTATAAAGAPQQADGGPQDAGGEARPPRPSAATRWACCARGRASIRPSTSRCGCRRAACAPSTCGASTRSRRSCSSCRARRRSPTARRSRSRGARATTGTTARTQVVASKTGADADAGLLRLGLAGGAGEAREPPRRQARRGQGRRARLRREVARGGQGRGDLRTATIDLSAGGIASPPTCRSRSATREGAHHRPERADRRGAALEMPAAPRRRRGTVGAAFVSPSKDSPRR